MFGDGVLDYRSGVTSASLVPDPQLPDGAPAVGTDPVGANVPVAISLPMLLAGFDGHGDICPVIRLRLDPVAAVIAEFAQQIYIAPPMAFGITILFVGPGIVANAGINSINAAGAD